MNLLISIMENNLAAVIVETRPLANLQKVIEDHLRFLPEHVALYVFGSEHVNVLLHQSNFKYWFADIGRVMTEKHYNILLTSKEFWNYISEENVIIFQHDSEILRPWDDDFYNYEYLGAPWIFQNHGGNGGLSFRKKSEMIKAIEKFGPYDQSRHGNEDVFFSNAIYQTHSHYNKEACKRFSCESIYQLGTFGCHAIDKYLTPQECDKIRRQYENI